MKKLETATLLRALQLAKPCLGGTDAVQPILSHFCFSDDVVYAWNDVCGVIVEIDTGLQCALHGDTLLGVLDAAGSDEVEFRINKDGIVELKAGAGWVKLPSLPLKDSGFEVPDEETLVELSLSDDILTGLERCMVSIGEDALKSEFAGITVDYSKGKLVFYSSDNRTASRYTPSGKFISRKAVSTGLPAQAAALLQKLAATIDESDDIVATVALGTKMAVASFPGVTLVSRLLGANAEMFQKMFDQHMGETIGTLAIPEGLDKEIAKAVVLLNRDGVRDCFFRFGGGKVTVSAAGQLGKMESAFALENPKNKYQASACVDPSLVQRVLPLVDHWLCNDSRSVVFSGGSFVHVMSSTPVSAGRPRTAEDEVDDDIPF